MSGKAAIAAFLQMTVNSRVEKSPVQLRGSSASTACSVASLSLEASQKQRVTVVSVVSAYGCHGLLTVNRSVVYK